MSQASPLTPARRRAQELVAAGDLAGARAILEKAVDLGRANLAEDDPDVLLTVCHLARVYQRLDDPSAARRALEVAYAAGQWRLGDHDPLMVEISYAIGVVAEELGNRHEARKAFTRVAEYGPAALGAGHAAVARAQAYLGHSPDSVRSSAPPTPTGATEARLTLVTPIPAAPGFDEAATVELALEEPTEQLPPVAPTPTKPALVAPPPAVLPVWTPPEVVDEPTVAQPTISPRVPAQRSVHQQWGPPPSPTPPHHLLGPASAGMLPPLGQPAAAEHAAYRKRGLGLFAAIAAALASLIAVAALVFVLANRNGNPPAASDVPTNTGRAPTGVTLTDHGSRIEVRWADPSPGQVSFIVLMAHPGEQMKGMATLGPGTTSYQARGLNPGLNYCFAVSAVYSAEKFGTSGQSCTRRASPGPALSTGK